MKPDYDDVGVGRLVVIALLAFVACRSQPRADQPRPWQEDCDAARADTLAPPPTRRESVVDEIHGVRVADPYRWLENIADPEVKSWLGAQDAYARAYLATLPGRSELRARIRSLYDRDMMGMPARRGADFFYTRRHAGAEKPIYYRRPVSGGAESVVLDPNRLSADGRVGVRGVSVSPRGRYLAYLVSRDGADASTLRIRDVASGRDLGDTIPGARYASPSWTPDGRGFYYTGLPDDPSIPPSELPGYQEVRFHAVGADGSADEVVVPALGDPQVFVHVRLSRDGRFLVLSRARGWTQVDVSFRDMNAQDAVFRPLTVGVAGQHYVTAHAGQLYLHTNTQAPNFRVMRADPAQPQREHWVEVVPERKTKLESAQVIGGRLVLSYLERATSRVELRDLDGTNPTKLALPPMGTSSGVAGSAERDDGYISFISFTTPRRIYKLSARTGRLEPWHTESIPIDTSEFEVEQVWYRSRDGTPISMFIVHRAGLELEGSHPTVLTGYGGFGISLTPSFHPDAALWVDSGGVWAVPNLRGGGEYGQEWHDAGRLHNKQNVFDDFIAAAEFLIERGYTRPERLAIRGGSNGGLLVGAAQTQRPDLFAAVICAVPLLDMVRYHLFGSGRTWVREYGSADSPDEFRTLLAYSPYHRVRRGVRYPPLLMLAADNDDRVDPMHARKYTAAIQAAVPASVPALLRVEHNAGHGGADRMSQAIEQSVDTFAFLEAQVAGLARPEP